MRAVPGAAEMDDLLLDAVHTFAVGDGQFVVHNCATTDPYSGNVVDHPDPHGDASADKLADRIGGRSHVMFDSDLAQREFDAISDKYVAQTKPSSFKLGSQFRKQARATYEAAMSTGRTPYFHFNGSPERDMLRAIERYSTEYGLKAVLDTLPL